MGGRQGWWREGGRIRRLDWRLLLKRDGNKRVKKKTLYWGTDIVRGCIVW